MYFITVANTNIYYVAYIMTNKFVLVFTMYKLEPVAILLLCVLTW